MRITFFLQNNFSLFRFLINLVFANLLSTFLFLPLVIMDMLKIDQISGMCSIFRGILTLISSSSILAQLLIGIDQHLAVLNPLNYHRHINELRCRLLCICVWIFRYVNQCCQLCIIHESNSVANSTFFSSICLAMANAFDVTGSDLFQCCTNGHNSSKRSTYGWILTCFDVIMTFIIPTLVMCIMYFRIFIAARTNSIKTRRNSSCSMTIEGVHQIRNNGGTYLSVSNNNLARSPSVIGISVKKLGVSQFHEILFSFADQK